jgi:two-component system sensor histidine kinase KdpD
VSLGPTTWISHSTRHPAREVWRAVGGVAGVVVVTFLYRLWMPTPNATTVALSFLVVVLIVAATSWLWTAVATSLVAVFAFNFFFLPPVGTLTIADPQNWVALFAFLAVSLVASNLSAIARARTQEALDRRDELARLFDLSREVLVITESHEAMTALARAIARRFDLEFVAVALPRESGWDVSAAGLRTLPLDHAELSRAFASAQTTLEFDAYARTYAGHRPISVDGTTIRLVPLRSGTRPIGLLAAAGRPIEAGTLDTLAGLVAIAIERAQFLEERKSAALTRQSEELKTALLASLGHDLRTPLTAIRVAASNLVAPALAAEERRQQSEVILTEVERLTRLFQNILEMARIDAGAVSAEARWTHPTEVIAAARAQVEQTLHRHSVRVDVEPDRPVQLDPRLTATALAHLLENAAQYSPPGSVIEVISRMSDEGLVLTVRDHGPGIAGADLPHVFERFYRGAAATSRVSGTGMGLAIARGLLAVEKGRVWAENCRDEGTQFIIVVPTTMKEAAAAGASAS